MRTKALWGICIAVALAVALVVLVRSGVVEQLTPSSGVMARNDVAVDEKTQVGKDAKHQTEKKGKFSRLGKSASNARQNRANVTVQRTPNAILERIFELMDSSAVFSEIEKILGAHPFSDTVEDWKRLDADQRRELRALLASDKFNEVYCLLKELSQFDSIDFNIDSSSIGMMFQTPELKGIQDLEMCLQAKSLSDAADGDAVVALESLSIGLRLSYQTRTDTTPESVMTRMGIDNSLLSQLGELIKSGGVEPQQAASLIDELVARNYPSSLVPSFDTDKLMMENEFNKIIGGDSRDVERLSEMFDIPSETLQSILGSRETIDRNLAACGDYTRRFQELCAKPFYESEEEIMSLQREIEELPEEYSLVKLFLSGNTSFVLAANVIAHTMNKQLVEMATTIYKERNQGASPATTDDLLGILSEIPVNPLTGGSYNIY